MLHYNETLAILENHIDTTQMCLNTTAVCSTYVLYLCFKPFI